MATQEEISLILKMVADIGDAQKVISVLNQVQTSAQQTQEATNQVAQNVGKVTDAEARSIANANAALQAGMKSMEPTLKNFQDLFKQIERGGVGRPTLGPEAFGIQGKAVPTEAPPAPTSLAFATFQAARQRGLAGGVDPVEQRLEAARRAQVEQYAKLNAQLEREANIEKRAADAAEARSARVNAGFRRLQEAQGQRETLSSEEDPQVQARLFAARAAQQRQFDQLINERARTGQRGVSLPTEGIPESAVARLTQAREELQGLGNASNVTFTNMVRLVGTFAGFGIGLSLWSAAGRLAHDTMAQLIDAEVQLEQVTRQNSVTLGQQAAGFQNFASTTSTSIGVMQRELLEAGTTATQFGREIGFGPEQVTGLTAVATLLARIRGEDVSKTMTQLTSAMQGNAQAANALGLNLTASYLAYTRLGGATAEVFNQLSPGTQEWIRYGAAVEQATAQLQGPVTPSQELAAAMETLGTEMERVGINEGPALIRGLAELVILAATAVDAFNALDETLSRFKPAQAGADLHNAIAGAVSGTPLANIGKGVGDFFNSLGQQTNRALGITSDTATAAADNKMEQLQSMLAQAGGPLAQLQAARQQEIAATKELVNLRQTAVQVAAQEARIRLSYLPQQQQTAMAQNQAQQAQVAMQQGLLPAQREIQDLVNATSRTQIAAAQQVLPAQREMEDLQRRMTQQQILAQQATLPSSRALEDLQAQIELRRIIAEDPTRTWSERQAAMQQGRILEYQVSRAQEAALRARIGATPAQRAAEDVGTAAQLQGLDIAQTLAPTLRAAEDAQRAAQQLTLEQADAMKDIARRIEDLALEAQKQALEQAAALIPLEFQQQSLTLLGTIAEAAKAAAQKTIEIALGGVQVVFQGTQISNADYEQLKALVGPIVADIIRRAVGQSNTEQASMSLVGAGGQI